MERGNRGRGRGRGRGGASGSNNQGRGGYNNAVGAPRQSNGGVPAANDFPALGGRQPRTSPSWPRGGEASVQSAPNQQQNNAWSQGRPAGQISRAPAQANPWGNGDVAQRNGAPPAAERPSNAWSQVGAQSPRAPAHANPWGSAGVAQRNGAPPAAERPNNAWSQGGAQSPSAPVQANSSASAAVAQRNNGPPAGGRPYSNGDGARAPGSAASRDPNDRKRITAAEEFVHTRPRDCVTKSGKDGKNVMVTANYFRLTKKPEWAIIQYRVDFAPEIDSIHMRRRILGSFRERFGGFVFDGTVLFTTKTLYDVDNAQCLELMTKTDEHPALQIKIKQTNIVRTTDIQLLQVLNLILRKSMSGLDLQLVMRNLFDPRAQIDLKDYKLQIWPGYVTSIRQHENDILMCTEIAHKVMRTDNLLMLFRRIQDPDPMSVFKREVIGTIVLTGYNNRTYRIDDVCHTESPMSTFQSGDRNITYVEYYNERYGIKIVDRGQFLLLSKPTEKNRRGGIDQPIYLIPELCRATGLTDSMKNDHKLMRAVASYTRLTPQTRIERLSNFNRRLQNSNTSMSILREWDVSLEQQLVQVPARILDGEKILFGRRSVYTCTSEADWTKQLRGNEMYKSINFNNWHVISPRRHITAMRDFVKECMAVGRGMNLIVAQPSYYEINDDKKLSYARALKESTSLDPQIVMVLLPNNSEDRYQCVKKACCLESGTASQVVLLKTIAPRQDKMAGLKSIATKVVIQMNAKILGVPWLIDLPLNGSMIIGFDVCHSGKDRQSYGALVATMDIKRSAKYFSHVTQHSKGQELSSEISSNVAFAVKKYFSIHNALPESIIFYRDGVGDGQLHQVYSTELEAIKKVLVEFYKTAPKLTYVVVTKRINTRFFLGNTNPPPGTVVDKVITQPERFDFYLVSQSVRQGTVSPTCYNVLYNSCGFPPDILQKITYKMTHLYYNWSGTCRVPMVCQYAHKLAYLVGESLFRAPNQRLSNQLYFL